MNMHQLTNEYAPTNMLWPDTSNTCWGTFDSKFDLWPMHMKNIRWKMSKP